MTDALHRGTHRSAAHTQSMTTEQLASIAAPPNSGTHFAGAVAFHLRIMQLRRPSQPRARFAALLASLALPVALSGCNCSPRQEYLQTRAVEITPSSSGDGTLLANRDKIMTGDKGPSAPLAAVEAPTPDKQ